MLQDSTQEKKRSTILKTDNLTSKVRQFKKSIIIDF